MKIKRITILYLSRSGRCQSMHTNYYLDGSMIIAEDRDGVLIQYYYDNSGVIGMNYEGIDYYFNKNLFGDIVEIRKAADNTLVATYSYDAWGNCTVRGDIGLVNPFRYRGYYMDDETGFYYLQTRYYNAVLGRFLNADNYELLPILSQDISSMNLYVYCGNNPVMFTDENGEMAFIVAYLIKIGISAVIGAISGGISAYLSGQNFWLGFAAGAIGGTIGGIMGTFNGVGGFISRGVGSFTYSVLNEYFQNGSLDNFNWSTAVNDAIIDTLISAIYSPLGDGIVGDVFSNLMDGFVDILQTAAGVSPNNQFINYAYNQPIGSNVRSSRCQSMPTNLHLVRRACCA